MISPKIRRQFPVVKKQIYLNTAATGLISKPTSQAGEASFRGLHQLGTGYSDEFLAQRIPEIFKQAQAFLNAKKSELCIIPSFSYGLNLLLSSLPKSAKFLVLEKDYPSLKLPITQGQFSYSSLKPKKNGFYDEKEILRAVKSQKPDLLLCSQISYNTGQRLDVEWIAEEAIRYNCRVILDTTQSAGMLPLNFKTSHCSAFIMSNYKWLNAGFGNGLMCVKTEFLKVYPPQTGGFGSLEWKQEQLKLQKGIRQYQPAHFFKPALAALSEALLLHRDLGSENIWEHNHRLMTYFLTHCPKTVKILGNRKASDYGAFCVIADPKMKLSKRLTKNGITHTYRFGNIRFGFHFYNTLKEVKKTLSVIGG